MHVEGCQERTLGPHRHYRAIILIPNPLVPLDLPPGHQGQVPPAKDHTARGRLHEVKASVGVVRVFERVEAREGGRRGDEGALSVRGSDTGERISTGGGEEQVGLLGMQQLFVLVIRFEKVLGVCVRAEDYFRRLDGSLGRLHVPRAVVRLVDGSYRRMGEQLTVGVRRGDCLAHESRAEAVSGEAGVSTDGGVRQVIRTSGQIPPVAAGTRMPG